MSLLYVEGFDWFSGTANTLALTGVWSGNGSSYITSIYYNSILNNILKHYYPGYEMILNFGSPQGSTITIGGLMAFSSPSVVFNAIAIQGSDASNSLILRYGGSNGLEIYHQPSATVIGVLNIPLISGWHFIEWTTYIHSTAGYTKLYMDNRLVIDVQDVDTTTGPLSDWDRIHFITPGYSDSAWQVWYLDSLYVRNDTTRYGRSTKVKQLKPTGPGDYAQFTPVGSTNNWENVDDLPVNITDYNYATNMSQLRDTFTTGTLEALDPGITNIYSVCPRVHAWEEDNSATWYIQTIIDDGTEYLGSSRALIYHAWIHAWDLYETNPSTSQPWTPAEVNGLKVGYYNAGS